MSEFAPPPRLAAAAGGLGRAGTEWLESLPDLVSELEMGGDYQWTVVRRWQHGSSGLFLAELGNELEARSFLEAADHLVGVLPASLQ